MFGRKSRLFDYTVYVFVASVHRDEEISFMNHTDDFVDSAVINGEAGVRVFKENLFYFRHRHVDRHGHEYRRKV